MLLVVFFLLVDVLVNGIHCGLRNAKRTKAILPNEFFSYQGFVVDEMCTAALDLLHDFAYTQVCGHAEQTVNVIGHAIDYLKRTAHSLEFYTYEFVKLSLHSRVNEVLSVFCGPYGMDPDA
jgi:hypothetical protein